MTNAQHTQWLEDVDNDEEVQALADHSKGRGAVQPKRPQQVAHRPAGALPPEPRLLLPQLPARMAQLLAGSSSNSRHAGCPAAW